MHDFIPNIDVAVFLDLSSMSYPTHCVM